MEHLYDRLKEYNSSDMYPYHMPGHKRRAWGELPESMYSMDITEITDFDNLHDADGIIAKLQIQAAQMYHADESFYLINGSTAGILSAISCAVSQGGRILMSRNCHKSSYHGAYLRELGISYLYPSYHEKCGILEAISPKQVEEALEQTPDVQAVLIVSPTYEGRIADVEAIAEIVHAKGIPLIVDEAHGAHLGLAEGFAKNSCQCGADLVIHSVHKTLPSLTQTALLHVNGNLIDRDKLRRFLRIYQTSSPSYLLMGSIDNALHQIETQGEDAFRSFKENCIQMMHRLSDCKNLTFLPMDGVHQDFGKLLISVRDTELTGKQLFDILRDRYHLELEMAAGDYALAMFTINDGTEAYTRMVQALLEVDKSVSKAPGFTERMPLLDRSIFDEVSGKTLWEAWDAPMEFVELQESVGRCAAEFVNLYPPGIPLLVPGELIREECYSEIKKAYEQGLMVQGLSVVEDVNGIQTIQIKVLQ